MTKKLSWLFCLLPIAVLCSSFYILRADAPAFIRWWLSFFMLGIIFMPFTSMIFKSSKDAGYLFSKALALALSSFVMWTFSYLHILPFRLISIIAILVIFAALNYILRKPRRSLARALEIPGSVRLMAIEETIFAASLMYWSFARGLKPLLDSLEKPMDFGFMMSMMRTDFLPAQDMWYAQGNINYYYYGQYVYTFITKMTGLQPDISYNLSMAATFALTLTLSFALCYMLISLAVRKGTKLFKIAPAIGGAIGAFFVTMGGNSHSFFYGAGHPGNFILKFLNERGFLAKMLPSALDMAKDPDYIGINISEFWFANSTRFIGYNPTTHDKTIHEFPFYSFLVADLHAHLINLVFVMLFIAILIMMLDSPKLKAAARLFWRTDSSLLRSNDKHWLNKELMTSLSLLKTTLKQPIFLLNALLLGIFMMCNFWDFAIYLAVMSMALLIVNLRGYGKLGTWETVPVFMFQMIAIFVPFLLISNPFLALLGFAGSAIICFGLLLLVGDAFTITGAQISLLFFVSNLATLPFNSNFEPMAKSVALTLNHTPVFQFAVLWGTHILIGFLFIIYVIRRRFAEKTDINAAAVHSRGKVAIFLSGMNPVDLFVSGLFVCGCIFLLLPEVIYVVDIYSGDYKRANTMFKFTYQAFVMLSLVIGYAVARLALTRSSASKVDNRWSFVSVLMIILLIIPAYYPTVATKQWLGDFKLANYQGLNGIEGLSDKGRLDAIHWINRNIKGQPVLLESYGDSYSEYNQLSAYTGLPTVMGWQTHEWLWRTSKKVTDGYNQIVRPRQTDVQAIYEYKDPAKATALLKKYKVAYIAVGQMEKEKFPDINESKLKTLGQIVFNNDSLYIIKIS
ncbi:MAG: DUF2298 domain-containing protein [Saccharofermentanales bacterium]